MVGARLCRGAALRLVLPGHRLRRHAAGRARRAAGRDRAAPSPCASTPTSIRGLPWRFEPEQRAIEVKLGEVVHGQLPRRRTSRRATTVGHAAFNVAPEHRRRLLQQDQCFCFTEQRLEPGETREMPVVFFVDPGDRQGSRARRPRHASRCPTPSIRACASRRRPVRGPRRRASRDELELGRDSETERRDETMADAHAKAPRLSPGRSEPVAGRRLRSRPSCSRSALISWMHQRVRRRRRWCSRAGALGVLYTMFGWWRDVIKEAESRATTPASCRSRTRYGMILFIASEVMFFVAWFWAFSTSRCSRPTLQHVARTELHRRRLAAEGHRDASIPGTCRCSTR